MKYYTVFLSWEDAQDDGGILQPGAYFVITDDDDKALTDHIGPYINTRQAEIAARLYIVRAKAAQGSVTSVP